MTATKFMRSLPPLVAGLLLGAAGWLGAANGSAGETLEFRPQLVVRPASAEVVTSKGKTPSPDDILAGRFSFEQAGFELELKKEGWPSSKTEIDEPRGMTTVRGAFPRSTLSVAITGDKETKTKLVELPKKTKLEMIQGQARLEPGRHELLVQADGYVPKRLSVNLKPGERKEVAMDLQAIPGFPTMGFPSGASWPSLPSAGMPVPPAYSAARPPAYTPPPPRYQAPAPYYPPAPVPRFTPIAPPPQPAGPDPVPMFTPIGN